MTYASGNIIRKGHYNRLVTGSEDGTYNATVPNIGTVWGVGSGRYGYGQQISTENGDPIIAPVEIGKPIEAADWDNLDSVIANAIGHQLGPGNYTDKQFQVGQLIAPIGFDAGIQLAYSGVGKCFAPRESDYSTQFSGAWGSPANRKLKVTQTLNFESADHARWFFNAGGKLKMSFDFTPSPLNLQSAVWENITQSAGVVAIGYTDTDRIGGSTYDGSHIILPNNQGGYWSNTSGTVKEHFRQLPNPIGRYNDLDSDGIKGYYGHGRGTYGYYEGTDDFLKVEMLVSDSNGLNGNIGKTVSVITTLVTGQVSYAPVGNTIQGTFKVNMTVSKPTTDYLAKDVYSLYNFAGSAGPEE